MRQGDVERWAIQVLDRLQRGGKAEDDRVELKRVLPEARKAARRIAGHANQVREDRILWLIGVDEAPFVIHAGQPSEGDLANWWPQVEAFFDLPPTPIIVRVAFLEQDVLALGFESDRVPYVVKVSEGGEVSREVPWREGTRTRSANRSDLLRLLVPVMSRPRVTVLSARLHGRHKAARPEHDAYDVETETAGVNWQGSLGLYVDTVGDLTFPHHRCTGYVTFGSLEVPLELRPMAPFRSSGPNVTDMRPRVAVSTDGQLLLQQSSPMSIRATGGPTDIDLASLAAEATLHVSLGTAGLDIQTLSFRCELQAASEESADRSRDWQLSHGHR